MAQIIQPWHVLLAGLVTPDALLAWHRSLVAGKWDQSKTPRGPGRPVVMKEIETLVVRFAPESPNWGYRRVEGALANLGHTVAWTTVANILKPNDIDPAPERGKKASWITFLGAHWATVAAIELRGRHVHFAGIGFFREKRFCLMDRDTKVHGGFSHLAGRCRHGTRSSPGTLSQYECLDRVLHAFDQIGVSQSKDLLR